MASRDQRKQKSQTIHIDIDHSIGRKKLGKILGFFSFIYLRPQGLFGYDLSCCLAVGTELECHV